MDDNTITVDRRTLQKAYEFFHSLEAADAIYKSCQNTAFRQFAQQCLRAANTQAAFARLQELLGENI